MTVILAFLSRARLSAAAFLACVVVIAAAPAMAQPAMWVVKDADSTIYLMGTVHVLRPETVWHNPKLDDAIASADQLYLEIPIASQAEMMQSMLPLVTQYGLSPNKPLSSRLTPDEYKTLQEAAKDAGLPEAGLNIFRPWFAGMGISAAGLTKSGYDPESGVDTKLQKIFKERGIAAKGLETIEYQIKIFANMSEADEMDYLRSCLKDYKETATELDKMVSQWAAGDLPAMEKIFVTELKDESSDLYKTLLVDRNKNWASEIQEMLKGKGVTFIAVGAGHLMGPDSVQVQLKALGIEAKRY
ncbi:MAG TPA: TraB/GumN family protein [Hyphomonadaceae bacterium]|nr:TraB/GumN family protein [Hyphomonadaceae bacterium]